MTDRARFSVPRGPRVGALVLCLSISIAGCSSNSGTKHNTSSSSSNSAASIDPATKAAIIKAYATFFSPKSPEAASLASLQHGQSFKAIVEKEAQSSQAQSASAKVSAVRLLSPKVADVTFTIYTQGQAVLPNTHGKAVLDGGKWKVAAETFCALLKLEGTAPTFCDDPKFTAVPS
jgi:hypothetical protein